MLDVPEEPKQDPYAGADLTNARRMSALLWALSSFLGLLFLPLSPPRDPSRLVAWVGIGLMIVCGLAMARLLLDEHRAIGFDQLLWLNYLGIALVAVAVWLTGGYTSVYDGLFLLAVAAGVGVHPPRRAIPLLGVLSVTAAAPLLYEGWSAELAKTIAADLLLWLSLGAMVMLLMMRVRAQRVELAERESRQAHLARVDPLTGLGNRRAFEEALAIEGARSRRAGSTLSLVVLDVDDFKAINDGFGHEAGDRVLHAVAETIRKEGRASDRAFRWGGDEFAVLLPDTDLEHARAASERILRAVSSCCSAPDGEPLQISYGTSVLTGDAEERMLPDADAALYGRKQERSGLDRV